jgi:hypothetical protein
MFYILTNPAKIQKAFQSILRNDPESFFIDALSPGPQAIIESKKLISTVFTGKDEQSQQMRIMSTPFISWRVQI